MNFTQLKKALELFQDLQCFGFSTIQELIDFANSNPDYFWQEIKARKIDLEKETQKTK